MFLRNRRFLVIVSTLAVVAALAIPVAAMALPAAQTAPAVKVEMTASPLENGVATYQIFVTNNSSESIEGLAINVPLPAGTQMQSSYAGSPGMLPASMTTTGLQWVHGGLTAGETTGPYAFVVGTSQTSIPAVNAVVTWTGPVAGSAASTSVAAMAPAAPAQPPRRGCFACHAPGTTHNLVEEADSRAEAAGFVHPPLAEDVTTETCLTCHGSGTGDREGLGTSARLSLRDILHPSHMSSAIFTQRYAGNCFTCHNVQADGTFILLNDKLETNVKGLPTNPPVTGILPPSAAGK